MFVFEKVVLALKQMFGTGKNNENEALKHRHKKIVLSYFDISFLFHEFFQMFDCQIVFLIFIFFQ